MNMDPTNGERADPVDVGIVIPTLGTRPAFLEECLRSVRDSGPCRVVLVRPVEAQLDSVVLALVDELVDDPGTGLAAAIDAGLRSFPPEVQYVSWLGDDDRLITGALTVARRALADPAVAYVFGACRYIDAAGTVLWLNRSGRWAVPLMRFGPQMVPQPGSLFTRRAYEAVGGLDPRWKWAFDLDLLLKLGRVGKAHHIPQPLADFRWHPGSLSVGGRRGSVIEASSIRVMNLPKPLRPLSFIWEPLLRRVILLAGSRLSRKIERSERATSRR